MPFGTFAHGAETYGEGSITDFATATVRVEIAFDSDPYDVTQTYTDVTAVAEGISTRSGRRSEFDHFSPGSADVILDNADRRFDPTNDGSAYYPNVVPMRRLRITATWAGVSFPLFVGFIEDWPQSYARNGRVLPVELSATDVLGALAGLEVPGIFIELDDEDCGILDKGRLAGTSTPFGTGVFGIGPFGVGNGDVIAERTGARLNRMLSLLDWPTAERDIDSGITVLPVGQPKGNALSYAQMIQETEDGRVFAGPDGKVVLRDRHAPYTRDEMATSQHTVSDDVDETDLAYSNLEPHYSRDLIRNHVQIKLLDGEMEYEDATSIARFGRHTHSRTTLLTDPDAAQNYGEFVVSRYKDPLLRFEQVRIAVHANPEALFPVVLTRRIGDRVTVLRRPDVGDPIISECHIEGVAHVVGNDGSWYTTWSLSPADIQNYLILDDPALGLLDTALTAY